MVRKVCYYYFFNLLSKEHTRAIAGDSFSDSSEALSPRGRVGIMMYMKYFGRRMYVVKRPSW